MARLDTIRALEKRGLSPELAEKTVDLGYLLGTLKKASLKELRKNFYYKEILQLIDVSKKFYRQGRNCYKSSRRRRY